MKKIALISTYCDSSDKIELLKTNITKVKSLGLDTLVISPITLPSEIIELSDFVFFTKENPLLTWPVRSFTFWRTIFTSEGWVMLHHNLADYGWAGLYQIKKMSQIALSYEYDLFYHMIYDLDIDDHIQSEILSNEVNIIHPRINPRNPEEIWEATLHFMVFDREIMSQIVEKIILEDYLGSNGVAEGQALKWSKDLKIKISDYPVKDLIYYWEDKDFFNYSKNNKYKFYFSKNEGGNVWVGDPLKEEFLDDSIRIIFYEITEPVNLEIRINGSVYNIDVKNARMFNFKQSSVKISEFVINDGEYINDLTKTINETNRNLVYYETIFK